MAQEGDEVFDDDEEKEEEDEDEDEELFSTTSCIH